MKKILISILFLTITLVACENKKQNLEKQKVSSKTETAVSVNTQKKEIYSPAIESYLINQFGEQYNKGKLCIPFQVFIGVDDRNRENILVWGYFGVFNYNLVGDTLETVSGGNHPGLMHIKQTDKGFEVTAFDEVEDTSDNMSSAMKIFGDKYDKYLSINNSEQKREKARAEFLASYIKNHGITVTKYKDLDGTEKQIPVDKTLN
jgi:hypothetical protein